MDIFGSSQGPWTADWWCGTHRSQGRAWPKRPSFFFQMDSCVYSADPFFFSFFLLVLFPLSPCGRCTYYTGTWVKPRPCQQRRNAMKNSTVVTAGLCGEPGAELKTWGSAYVQRRFVNLTLGHLDPSSTTIYCHTFVHHLGWSTLPLNTEPCPLWVVGFQGRLERMSPLPSQPWRKGLDRGSRRMYRWLLPRTWSFPPLLWPGPCWPNWLGAPGCLTCYMVDKPIGFFWAPVVIGIQVVEACQPSPKVLQLPTLSFELEQGGPCFFQFQGPTGQFRCSQFIFNLLCLLILHYFLKKRISQLDQAAKPAKSGPAPAQDKASGFRLGLGFEKPSIPKRRQKMTPTSPWVLALRGYLAWTAWIQGNNSVVSTMVWEVDSLCWSILIDLFVYASALLARGVSEGPLFDRSRAKKTASYEFHGFSADFEMVFYGFPLFFFGTPLWPPKLRAMNHH